MIAVDIGGSSTRIALVSRRGGVAHWQSFATEPPIGRFREELARRVRQTAESADGGVLGTACAVAGFVDEKGTLLYNGNLPWLEGKSLSASLHVSEAMPLVVESDSNAACAGEHMFGAAAKADRLLCVTVGTGVGMGMMVGGKLVRTAYGCLGDAGHVVVEPEGPACTCGGRGCAEAVLSTVMLGRRYDERGFRALVADTQAGHEGALAQAGKAGEALGVAVASVANIFLPQWIAIAGGLAHLGAPLVQAADASFRRHAGEFITRRAHMALAETGSHATLLGAAACFFASAERPVSGMG